jgi:hypothetical protein
LLKGLVCMSFLFARRPLTRTALLAAAVLAAAAASAPAAVASAASGPARHASNASNVRPACAPVTRPGVASCTALIRTDIRQRTAASLKGGPPTGVGYGPADLQSAYKLPSATAGAGQTVAIVLAFDDPNAASDLAAYRAAWGLPACDPATGAGCLTKVNQLGQASPLPAPAGTSGWATEESMAMDMVSAVCPLCHIYLVETVKPGFWNLGTGVDSAVRLGARYVDNPYIGFQGAKDPTYDTRFYQHPGDAIVASASSFIGNFVGYPAASQYVTAVGGTSLLPDPATARGWSEHVWGAANSKLGTGSGCTFPNEHKPVWQQDTGCKHRTDNDVSAVASPHTGVAVYDTYDQHGWFEMGGTGVAASIITAVYALAGPPALGTYPASYPYAYPQALFDVTIGSNGTCTILYLCNAQVGYDGPSGLGTPDGVYAFGYHG